MGDFSAFIASFPTFIIVLPMMAIGLIMFAPDVAKYGIKKIELMFGISFKDGFARLEAQKQAREYYRNNRRINRPVPYRWWRK
jgi:hypothetical protein